LADLRATTSEELFDEVSQIVCQMVPIGYLPGLRGPFTGGGGIILSSVAADDINLWMRLHPSLGRFRLPIREQINNLMGSYIDENGPESATSAEAPVVNH
jgi:hypothetical protein